MALLRRVAWASIAALLLCAGGEAASQPLVAGEDEVKAAFLYRFGGFVEWPAHAFADDDARFVIAVAGAETIADHLEKITVGRTTHGRPIEIRRIARGEDVGTPQVLFIGRDARRFMPTLITMTEASATLVVTEFDGAVSHGSMIDLVVVDERVRFDVAPGTAERRGLKVSSKVLAIARRVTQGD